MEISAFFFVNNSCKSLNSETRRGTDIYYSWTYHTRNIKYIFLVISLENAQFQSTLTLLEQALPGGHVFQLIRNPTDAVIFNYYNLSDKATFVEGGNITYKYWSERTLDFTRITICKRNTSLNIVGSLNLNNKTTTLKQETDQWIHHKFIYSLFRMVCYKTRHVNLLFF